MDVIRLMPPDRRKRARWMRDCKRQLAAGHRVQVIWSGRYLDARQWHGFMVNLINADIMRRAGGPPHSIGDTTLPRSNHRVRALRPWRNWGHEAFYRFQRDAISLYQARRYRAPIYQFETKEVTARFGHLLSRRHE
jgi:hypothetical protein